MWDWPCILTLLLKLPERVYRWEDVILDEPTPLLTSQVALEVNNPPAFAGDIRDAAGFIYIAPLDKDKFESMVVLLWILESVYVVYSLSK